MSTVELIPLKCVRCGVPVEAEINEVVWICSNCGQGLQLDPQIGLAPLNIRYVESSGTGTITWLPFWVAKGVVKIDQRETYSVPAQENTLWDSERTFIVPAYNTPVQRAVELTEGFIRHPVKFIEGPAQPFVRVTTEMKDVRSLAEFAVLNIEAQRRDRLKAITFDLQLSDPELWIIPFRDDPKLKSG